MASEKCFPLIISETAVSQPLTQNPTKLARYGESFMSFVPSESSNQNLSISVKGRLNTIDKIQYCC